MLPDPIMMKQLVEAQHQERLNEFEKYRMAKQFGVPVQNQFLARISASIKALVQQFSTPAQPTIDIRRTTASYPVVK